MSAMQTELIWIMIQLLSIVGSACIFVGASVMLAREFRGYCRWDFMGFSLGAISLSVALVLFMVVGSVR